MRILDPRRTVKKEILHRTERSQRRLAQGSSYENAGVGFEAIQVVGKTGVNDDLAVIARGAGVHEAEHAFLTERDADMRGPVGVSISADDADDVTILEL